MPSFQDFVLQPAMRAALANMEISEPTPIQAAAIPALLAGSDLVGQSATGSGKTLAYGIPLVERLARDKRSVQALVLLPTRELAVQVSAVLARLGAGRRLSIALLVGGRPYGNQISALRYGSQIVVGTPGRVKDHLERGTLVLSQLRMCVLDEADQPAEVTDTAIAELMQLPRMAESFVVQYTETHEAVIAEGNVSRPAPNGTSAAGLTTAEAAVETATVPTTATPP